MTQSISLTDKKLHSKLCDLQCSDFLAIFTCEPLVLMLGCFDGKLYMIDTQLMMVAPGKRESFLIGKKILRSAIFTLHLAWKRLHHQGLKPGTSTTSSYFK